MLLDDFYWLGKVNVWQSPKGCWLAPAYRRPESLLSVCASEWAHVGMGLAMSAEWALDQGCRNPRWVLM